MKYILITLAIATTCCSCKNTWDQEDKDAFYQSCMEDANTWAGDHAKPYCDCVMDKVMKKYPHEADALEHMDSVINDPDIQSCKVSVPKQ